MFGNLIKQLDGQVLLGNSMRGLLRSCPACATWTYRTYNQLDSFDGNSEEFENVEVSV